MPRPPFTLILTGFIIWSAAFLVLYGTQATGCRLGWHEVEIGPASALRWLLATMVVLVLALLVGLFRSARIGGGSDMDAPDTLRQIVSAVHLAAIVSTFITYSGVFWLTLC